MSELDELRREITELRTFVLQWQAYTQELVLCLRETGSHRLSAYEDFLKTPYDRSLLAKRYRKSQQ
jgi:hypothetical protein